MYERQTGEEGKGIPVTMDTLRASLQKLMPGWLPPVERLEKCYRIALPIPPGADYGFDLRVYNNGGGDISAVLLGHGLGEFFWFQEIECGPRVAQGEIVESLVEIAAKVVRFPSRIRQSRGWLWWSFRCEVLEEGQWQRLAGIVACLRWDSRVSLTAERSYLFQSPPLSTASPFGVGH